MTGTITPIKRNRQKRSTSVASKPSWRSGRRSLVARYVEFVESQLVVPKGNGAREPFELHGFQRDLFEEWLDPVTRAAMTKIGRGNTKTTTLASFLVAHAFVEDDADVPIVATTLEQSRKTTYGVASRLIELSPLAERVKTYTGIGTMRLAIPETNGVLYPVADNPKGLQGLDPSVAVLDEAAFASIETWEALLLASGKRPKSLCIGIGTPSFMPENAMLSTERAMRAGQTLPGFVWHEWSAPEGCDHRDERVWALANPALVTRPPILSIDAVRTTLALSTEQAFRCFRLAQWPTASSGGWLGEDGYETWTALEDPYDLVPGVHTWAGVDMAKRHDTAAVVLGQYRDDGRFHVVARIWYPEPNKPINPAEIMQFLRRAHADYNLQALWFDPRYFDLPARMLEEEGLNVIEVPQTAERMTPAVGGCFEAIQQGLLTHDGDAAFTQQVLNAQPHYTETGFTLSKLKSDQKIDATVAMCMCHRAASSAESYTDGSWVVY